MKSLVNVIGQKIQRATTMEETLQTAIRERLGNAIGASRVRAKLASGYKHYACQPQQDPVAPSETAIN